jgi:hypothetical protein
VNNACRAVRLDGQQADLLELELEVVRSVRSGFRLFERDETVTVELDQSLIEGLHPVVVGFLDDVVDVVGLVCVDDAVSDAPVIDHYLDRRRPAPADFAQEPLRHHTYEGAPQRQPDLLLLMGGEEVDDPVDRFGHVRRV